MLCYVTKFTVRRTTGCPTVSRLIRERQLRFFGHVARAYPTGSPSGHWGVAATGQSLEETLWMPSYQLAEGD